MSSTKPSLKLSLSKTANNQSRITQFMKDKPAEVTKPEVENTEVENPEVEKPLGLTKTEVTMPVAPTFQMAEVVGIITDVEPYSPGKPTRFRIKCPNSGKSYWATYGKYLPVKVNDSMYAYCMLKDGELYVQKHPICHLPTDENSILKCFLTALKSNFTVAKRYYETVFTISGNETTASLISFLNSAAQLWYDKRAADLLQMFGTCTPSLIQKLLEWWHRERNVRNLRLLGLDNKEIRSCTMTQSCDAVFNTCMTNPYTLSVLSIEKCDGIMDSLNKIPLQEDRIKGFISKIIYQKQSNYCWTYTPYNILLRQFPQLPQYLPDLIAHYGVVVDGDRIYLKHAYEVEVFLANFMIKLQKKESLQTHCELEFTRELSPDQKLAIEGAFKHNISIITGGPGTGKCLAPNTKILMFDGSITKAKDVKVGDLLMGPDSKPRTLLSVCSGTDEMYRIKPRIGRAFECNKAHILTLKSSYIPIIRSTNYLENGFYVSYTELAIIKQKYFTDLNLAKQFMKELQDHEDIFDVSVEDYLQWDLIRQHLCQVFHVPVDFGHETLVNRRERFEQALKSMEYRNGCQRDICVASIRCYICPKNRELEYLANTLGIITEKSDGLLHIYTPNRKHNTWEKILYIEKSRRAQPFTITSLGLGQYNGFTLQGDPSGDLSKHERSLQGPDPNANGRFLLSDCLVTHNTTCLGEIVHNLELQREPYVVCSYMGKAVARIKEVTTKSNPATLHRLINNAKLDRQLAHKIKHVVIDESPTVSSELLYLFLKEYVNIEKITFIGDVNQLPPKEWGNLCYELIKSKTIPTYYLTTNYRVYTEQGEVDGIILNANNMVNYDFNHGPFMFINTLNFNVMEGSINRIYDILQGCFTAGVKLKQIVVLTPYVRYLSVLNTEFQKIFDVGARSVTDKRGVKWMIGDRVMLTENDKQIKVYNGESGIIIEVTDKAITVDFGYSGVHDFLLESDNSKKYKGLLDDEDDADEVGDRKRTVLALIHAYAITIDKSQGSEWDFVLVYFPEFNMGSFICMNRVFTAPTRGKRCCWIVTSDIEKLELMAVKPLPKRFDWLSNRLALELPKIEPIILKSELSNMDYCDADLGAMPDDYDDGVYD
jgi:hypothetical protein